ncbi:MAG: carbon monoxide dehydrogenase [Desulfitibacter sp. BRH_c19]|nr:MAG: carbon monoxide dehydrogenase [Desulfitibacter sp. BRH_c19]
MKIAVSGKGGVGKTTISAGLTKFFLNKGYKVFAVDADPDVSLGTILGIDDNSVEGLKPIVEMREVISKKCGGDGAFFPLDPQVDDILEDYIIQKGNLFFLKMGAVKQGGSSCYCRENTILNALVNSLLIKHKEIVLLDMGAGIEHLTRGTSGGVDIMLIVTEASKVSVNTALIVKKLAQELGVQHINFIGNKIRTEKEKVFLKSALPAHEILGFVEFNEEVLDLAMEFHPLDKSSAASLDLEAIGSEILARNS